MQDDDRPLLGLEAAEGTLELVAVGDRRQVVGEEGQVQVGDVDVDLEGSTSDAPDLVDAGITSSRWTQASNRSGSRSVGRSRQARTRAFWTASDARSRSRSMSQAVALRREIAAPASTAKAS